MDNVRDVSKYFEKYGAPLPAYTNPADYLIRIGIDPKLAGIKKSIK